MDGGFAGSDGSSRSDFAGLACRAGRHHGNVLAKNLGSMLENLGEVDVGWVTPLFVLVDIASVGRLKRAILKNAVGSRLFCYRFGSGTR